jgi:hypothetical protein
MASAPIYHFSGADIGAANRARETNYIRLNLIRLQAGLAVKGEHDLGSLAYALKIGFRVAVA